MSKQYIELAIKITKDDYEKIPKKVLEQMWDRDNPIVDLNVKCEIIALGVEGFISKKIEIEG